MPEESITVWFPTASKKNPYHRLLSDALQKKNVTVDTEAPALVFPLTRKIIFDRQVDSIHLDWLYGFFMVRELTSSNLLNTLLTLIRTVLFFVDLIFANWLSCPIIWTVHNKNHHERKYYRIEQVVNTFACPMVDWVTTKCKSAKETVLDEYRVQNQSKVIVVTDGSYIDAYPNEVSKTEARQELDLNDDFVYLYFGIIRPYKGIESLVNTISHIDCSNSKLFIIGNPKVDSLKKRIEKKANSEDYIHTVFEYIPEKRVQCYMNAADVVVLPYRDILNSGSAHLAMSFGKPVIAPSMGCIPETVADHQLLYDPSSEHGLAESLRKAQNVDLDAIGEKNKKRAGNLTWASAATAYKSLYTDK
jgi:glycosyltransferase involved in cell wall biosynthesis